MRNHTRPTERPQPTDRQYHGRAEGGPLCEQLRPVGPIQCPVLDRLRDVLGLKLGNAVEVRNGARDFQDAVVGSGAQGCAEAPRTAILNDCWHNIIDFAEDDVSVAPDSTIHAHIAEVRAPLEQLAASFRYGQLVHEGLSASHRRLAERGQV